MYTIGTHNVARAHAPHCAAAESDFGLCPSLSLAGLLAHTVLGSNSGVSLVQDMLPWSHDITVYAPVMWRPGQRKKVCAHAYMC